MASDSGQFRKAGSTSLSHWIQKFRNAFRGIVIGSRNESSFVVHIPVAIAVILSAWGVGCTLPEWCLLLLCILLVLSLELMNSAIERLARGLCSERNQEVGNALDIASGAVLVASIGAAVVGLIILGNRLYLQIEAL